MIWFLAGVFVGSALGFFTCALVAVNRPPLDEDAIRADERRRVICQENTAGGGSLAPRSVP